MRFSLENKIDENDLTHVLKTRGERPIGWVTPSATNNRRGVITPNTSKMYFKNSEFVSVVHVKPVYYETIIGTWRPLSEVCTHHGNKRIFLKPDALKVMSPRFLQWLSLRQRILGQELLFDYGPLGAGIQPRHMMFATTTTVYPDPSPESTTVDGYINNNAVAAYTTVRNATAGNTADDTTANCPVMTNYKAGSEFYVRRAFFGFSVTAVGTDTISSAVLSLAGSGDAGENADSDGISICSGTPASNTAIVTGDFDQIGSTEYAAIASSSWVTTSGSYNAFTLSASGITFVTNWLNNTNDVGFLVSRSQDDLNAVAPTGGNVKNGLFADNTGTSADPKLVITHAPAGASIIPALATLGVGA